MYVCLCSGATCKTVADAVARGASTCKQVAMACGAGLDCGRCLRTLKTIVESESAALVAVAS
jgi:bacterioferritin-associated ferredoxin